MSDPDHTDDLPTLRERASELGAELRAVMARIHELEWIEAGWPGAAEIEAAPGPNAQVEGGDVVDAEHP
jgi:hypothetical protein